MTTDSFTACGLLVIEMLHGTLQPQAILMSAEPRSRGAGSESMCQLLAKHDTCRPGRP